MMRILIWLIAGLLSIVPLSAQNLDLNDCIQLALQHSTQLKKAALDRQVLENSLKEAKSGAYPQITGSLSYDYFPELPTQLLPGELFGRAGTYLPVQFNQPWQLAGSINLQQQLYSESGRRMAPAAGLARDMQQQALRQTESEVIFQTATLFYQILQAEQMLHTLDANMERVKALEKSAALQLQNGFILPIDLKRIQMAVNNLDLQRRGLRHQIESLQHTLQFYCGVSLDEPLLLEKNYDTPAADSARWQQLVFEVSHGIEHTLLTQKIELNTLKINSAKAENWPSIGGYATGTALTYRKDPYVFDIQKQWYGFAAMGVNMKASIFDGFKRKRKIEALKLERQKLDEDLRMLVAAKQLEFRLAKDQFQLALEGLRAQTANIETAREVEEVLQLQYKEGTVPLTDLLGAQTARIEAETGYWQQAFAYKLAVLRLMKTTGMLAAGSFEGK